MVFALDLAKRTMNIYNKIIEDHDKQRALCKKITDSSLTENQKESIWNELKKELEVHAVAEERYFYSPLIDSDKMQEDARHGMAEHHEMDELIEDINNLNYSDDKWMTKVEELTEKIEHHLKDEEEEFFDKAKKIYSDKEEEALAKGYESTMKEYKEDWPESIPG